MKKTFKNEMRLIRSFPPGFKVNMKHVAKHGMRERIVAFFLCIVEQGKGS